MFTTFWYRLDGRMSGPTNNRMPLADSRWQRHKMRFKTVFEIQRRIGWSQEFGERVPNRWSDRNAAVFPGQVIWDCIKCHVEQVLLQSLIQCRNVTSATSYVIVAVVVVVATADVACSILFVEVHVVGIFWRQLKLKAKAKATDSYMYIQGYPTSGAWPSSEVGQLIG